MDYRKWSSGMFYAAVGFAVIPMAVMIFQGIDMLQVIGTLVFTSLALGCARMSGAYEEKAGKYK
jgi:hypothetical protein